MPRQRASIASAFRERKLPMEEKKELLDQDERVVEIELERLRGFVNHPFKIQADSQMIELQEELQAEQSQNGCRWHGAPEVGRLYHAERSRKAKKGD